MIANASSSSAIGRLFDVPLGHRLPPLPAAFLQGRDRDLLEPLRLLPPGELPAGTVPVRDRRSLARSLGKDNDSYGHPRAEELAAKLADPSTRVVVTGQQPGLFGGPLLAASKAIAAVRWAEALDSAGMPAVAVFWVATEDHDWIESARASFPGRDGVERLDLGEDPAPLLPLGMRTLGEGLAGAAESVRGHLRGDAAAARLEQALGWYRPDTRFGEAFARLMVAVLGERAPLYLDSMSSEVKAVEAPFLRRLVEARSELDSAYERADAETEGRGYGLQVTPQPGLSPLFLLHGRERRRIEWHGDDRFGLRGLDDFEQPVSRLLEILDENPAVVSPGVLARPAIQDAILGTTLQVLGPSELAYMTQARATYGVLGIEAPWTTLRPQVMVLEGRQAEYLEELGVPLAAILDREIPQILGEALGEDFVTPARERIAGELEALRAEVLELDPSLERPFAKTRDHIVRGLETLSHKINAAVSRRHETWQRRYEQLRRAVLPGGHLQERELSTLFFWGRHGDALQRAIFEQMQLDPRSLSVIRLDA
ncbi:MAG: bacillithiol biosynthesis cysteine-adding enzyme BshC [Holophagales bacterium]|nr:bacillithiol biosynthesis cysteine-adding enzyme BshC [Holophagales bacterium]